MKSEISCHRATLADIEALVSTRLAFLSELFNESDDDKLKKLAGPIRDYLKRAIPAGDFIAWIAKKEDKLIATSGMVIWEMPAKFGIDNCKQGYIENMYTIPEERGQGICTALLEKLIDEARLKGIKYLHLHASTDGEGIYRKRGFKEPGLPELELRLE